MKLAADVAGAALLGLTLPNPYPDDTEGHTLAVGFCAWGKVQWGSGIPE